MSKETIKVNINSSSTHLGPEKSTTLNRRYVKRPTKIMVNDETQINAIEEKIAEEVLAPVEPVVEIVPEIEAKLEVEAEPVTEIISGEKAESVVEISPKISHINIEKPVETIEEKKEVTEEAPDLPPAPNPYQAALDKRKAEQERKLVAEISSKALKEAAIAKALAEMKSEEELKRDMAISEKEAKRAEKISKHELKKAQKQDKIVEKVMKKELEAGVSGKKAEKLEKLSKKQAKKAAKAEEKVARHIKKGRKGRVVLAFAVSAACMLALGFLVKVNLPNISVSVAAAQTGVEASYPNYTPRDFNLSGVYADDESVVIEFKGPNDTSFTLSEENTSWDSNALITNYVKGAYGKEYETITEGGTTIYVSHSNATWIKNNTLYKLNANAGTLTKRQIKNIVTSL